MSKIIQNAVYCKDSDRYYFSRYTHDYVSFSSGGMENLFIDGGHDYVRRSVMPDSIVDFVLYDDSPKEELKEKMLWGTRGKNGNDPFKWVLLKSCNIDHLQAIIDTQPQISRTMCETIQEIIKEKTQNND